MNNEQGNENKKAKQVVLTYGKKFGICFVGLFALAAASIFTVTDLAAGMSILEAFYARINVWITGALCCYMVFFKKYPNSRNQNK